MKKLIVFVILLFVLSISCYATEPAAKVIVIEVKCNIEDLLLQQNITCLEDDCSINVSKEYPGVFELNFPEHYGSRPEIITEEANYGYSVYYEYFTFKEGILFTGLYKGDYSIYQEVSIYFNFICVENTDDIEPIFTEEIRNWQNNMEVYVFSGMSLTFEPYSSARETELIETINSIESCEYLSYKRVGDWLIVSDFTEEYCEELGTQNSELRTQNIIGYVKIAALIFLAGLIGFLIYLFIRKKVFLFFLIASILGIFWAIYLFLFFASKIDIMFYSNGILLTLIAWIIVPSIIIFISSFWMRRPDKVMKVAILILILGVLSFNIVATIAGILGIIIGRKQEASSG